MHYLVIVLNLRAVSLIGLALCFHSTVTRAEEVRGVSADEPAHCVSYRTALETAYLDIVSDTTASGVLRNAQDRLQMIKNVQWYADKARDLITKSVPSDVLAVLRQDGYEDLAKGDHPQLDAAFNSTLKLAFDGLQKDDWGFRKGGCVNSFLSDQGTKMPAGSNHDLRCFASALPKYGFEIQLNQRAECGWYPTEDRSLLSCERTLQTGLSLPKILQGKDLRPELYDAFVKDGGGDLDGRWTALRNYRGYYGENIGKVAPTWEILKALAERRADDYFKLMAERAGCRERVVGQASKLARPVVWTRVDGMKEEDAPRVDAAPKNEFLVAPAH